MASYYNYFDNSAAGQHTRSEIIAAADDFGMGISQDIDCQDIDCRKVTATGEVKCTSTTAPFYPPVVTTAQRNAMTVTVGAMVYNSTTSKLNYYDGAWKVVEVAS